MAELHYLHSVLRERIVEHLFVGEMLRLLWRDGITNVEVLRSEFDRGGYDLVADNGNVLRHIQLKCSRLGAAAASQKVSLNLADRPSGCVIWIVSDDDLTFDHYLWFGSDPGAPLPDLTGFATAKHVKANAAGVKLERPNLRLVPKRAFVKLQTLEEVVRKLFGPSTATASPQLERRCDD